MSFPVSSQFEMPNSNCTAFLITASSTAGLCRAADSVCDLCDRWCCQLLLFTCQHWGLNTWEVKGWSTPEMNKFCMTVSSDRVWRQECFTFVRSGRTQRRAVTWTAAHMKSDGSSCLKNRKRELDILSSLSPDQSAPLTISAWSGHAYRLVSESKVQTPAPQFWWWSDKHFVEAYWPLYELSSTTHRARTRTN